MGEATPPAKQQQHFALFLDIDGVVMKDSKPILGAREALARVDGIPRVFVSNGGGRTEATRATQLTRELGLASRVDPQLEMVLPHTPMRSLAASVNTDPRPVLIVGRPTQSRDVAATLGLTHCVTLSEVSRTRPFLFPQACHPQLAPGTPIAAPDGVCAVFVLEEPEDWGEALQVIIDVLRCENGRLPAVPHERVTTVSEGQSVPVLIANPDFVYGGECCLVRFTVGAFRECLHMLYKQLVGRDMVSEVYGKPRPSTYSWARSALAKQLAGGDLRTIYCIGDNPCSDIRGARLVAKSDSSVQWVSILVRTGCFTGGDNDPDDPADIVVEDITEAIDAILRIEKSKEFPCEPSADASALFQRYTGIREQSEFIRRIVSIRDRALLAHPYVCISKFRFAEPRILGHPFVAELKSSRDTRPLRLLDLGCCMGTDAREIFAADVLDRTRGDDAIGIDLNDDLLQFGFELFGDKATMQSKFHVANVLDNNRFVALGLENSFDLVYAGSLLHLLSEQDCKLVASTVRKCLRDGGRGTFFGATLGSKTIPRTAELNPACPRHWLRFLHTPDSLRQMLQSVGFETVDIRFPPPEKDPLDPTQADTMVFMHFTAKSTTDRIS